MVYNSHLALRTPLIVFRISHVAFRIGGFQNYFFYWLSSQLYKWISVKNKEFFNTVPTLEWCIPPSYLWTLIRLLYIQKYLFEKRLTLQPCVYNWYVIRDQVSYCEILYCEGLLVWGT